MFNYVDMKKNIQLILLALLVLVPMTLVQASDYNKQQNQTKDHRDIFIVPDGAEDMSWATGGVCETPIDCGLTSMLFCNPHGGVAISIHDATDNSDSGCMTICKNGQSGSTACSSDSGGGDGDNGGSDLIVYDECDPDFIGPPNPNNSCWNCPDGSDCI